MNRIREWITEHPYIISGVIFLGMAVIGLKVFDWWRGELELLLILYVLALIGIRLDDLSRRIGNLGAAAKTVSAENGTILAKLNEIAHSLKVLNHYLAKSNAARHAKSSQSAAGVNPQKKLPTEKLDSNS